jgi:hypothetical protein
MRMAVFLTLFAAVALLSPGFATALPGALGDQAALGRDLGDDAVEPVAYRAKGRHKRYAKRYPRRYNWSYYPYWRPYQYRYWKFYYPYGGPLF